MATILGTLHGRGYAECAPRDLSVAQPLLFGDSGPNLTAAKRVARQSPVGTSIYGTPLAADFIIYGADTFPHGLAIESKWQHAQGSVDEKLPYLVLNIREGYRVPAIIVADGGGHHRFTLGELLPKPFRMEPERS